MEHAQQVELVGKLLAHLDAKTTSMAPAIYQNDISAFVCRDWLAKERDLLFRRQPLLMGLSCRLREPGDFLTDDHGGVPILVTRDKAGAAKAFVNLCRHRGAKLVEGCGKGKRVISCPYHAWSYDTDGRLIAVPEEQGFDGLDRSAYGLKALPIAERDGLIWVVPSLDAAIDVDAHLDRLAPELAGFGLDAYHHYETRLIRRRMNWKLVVDTFLESYHFKVLHKTTVGPILHPNLGLFDGFGRNLRIIYARKSIDRLRELPESDWDLVTHTAIVYVLFPNTVFVMQGDHVETWRVYPAADRPDESVMYMSLYTPEPVVSDSAVRHWDNNMALAIDTVDKEDFHVGEGIQSGFRAGMAEHVIYGRHEPALAHFHAEIRKAIGSSA